MVECWKKLKTSNVFVVCCVFESKYLSSIVRDLLSYNSLFVSQLYEDELMVINPLPNIKSEYSRCNQASTGSKH